MPPETGGIFLPELLAGDQSVAIVIGLVGPIRRHADVSRLLVGQLRQLGADFLQVQSCHHLVEMLGQDVHLVFVLIPFLEQLDLRQRLVGK